MKQGQSRAQRLMVGMHAPKMYFLGLGGVGWEYGGVWWGGECSELVVRWGRVGCDGQCFRAGRVAVGWGGVFGTGV